MGINHRSKEYHDVYRIDIPAGKAEFDTQNPGDAAGMFADNELKVRGCIAMLPDGGMEMRLLEQGGLWRTIYSQGPDETPFGEVGFSNDNKKIYLISSKGENAASLVELDIAEGEEKPIARDPQYDVDNVMANPITNKIEAVAFNRARFEWTVLDESVASDISYLQGVKDGDFEVLSRDDSDNLWTVAYAIDDGPVHYYLYDRKKLSATFLFTNRPKLDEFKLSKMQPITFTSRDGLAIHGYLTLPNGSSGKNLPLVLNVHGGPWARDEWGYDAESQWLANRGYATLQVNFRGSTGYGKEFLNAGDREWGAKMHDDLLDAKAWAIKEGYADPNKVAIMGGSYGGYATLAALAFTPSEFCCGIDIVGPSNLVTLINTVPPYWKPMRAMFDKRVGNVDTEKEFLESRSPLHKADQITAPLLIAQGANDPRVKQAESDQIVSAMRKNGREVEYIVFPDEGHGFARPENRMIFYALAEQFLAKHLGGTMEPAAPEEQAAQFLK